MMVANRQRRLSPPRESGHSFWWQHLWIIFHNHVFSLYYYGGYVQKYRLYFGQPKAYLNQWETRLQNRWALFWNFSIQGLFMFYFNSVIVALRDAAGSVVILGNIYVDGFADQHPFCALGEFMPHTGRKNFLMTIAIWSAMHSFNILFARTNDLIDYQFMAVFYVKDVQDRPHPKSTGLNLEIKQPKALPISRKNLDLTSNTLQKFVYFRKRALYMMYYCTWTLSWGAFLISTVESVRNYYWIRAPLWAAFWVCNVKLWCLYADYCAYGIPFFVLIPVYYLWLKQRTMLRYMDKLNRDLSRLEMTKELPKCTRARSYYCMLCLSRKYGRFLHETMTYNRMLKRLLSINLLSEILITTYTTYLLFFTRQEVPYTVLYVMVYITNLGLVMVLTLACAQISKVNVQLGMRMYKFYNYALKARIFSVLNMFKFQSITQNTIQTEFGLTLVDGFRITPRTFFIFSKRTNVRMYEQIMEQSNSKLINCH